MSLLQLANQQLVARGTWTGPISSKDPELAKFFRDSYRTPAGVAVTPENALTFSAVFDAVNQISSDVAKLPLVLRKRRPDGGSDPYEASKLHRLLKLEPNPEMDTMTFRQTLTAHALTWHGGFAEIERDIAGRPVALWPITPNRIEANREARGPDRNGRPTFGPLRYKVDGGAEFFSPRDILHIQGLGWAGEGSYRVIDLSRKAIGLALAMEQFGSSFFANGSTFGGILTVPQVITDPEEKLALRKQYEDLHQTSERAFKFLMLQGGITYTPTGVEPDKSQLNQSRDKQVEEVARFFNMPLHKLKSLERATNNNIESQDLEYYKGCLLNWITRWELEIQRKLISPLEQRQQFVKHNANAFLRGDTKSRSEFYSNMLQNGVFSADDVLDLEDMNPQPDGQGKVFLVNGTMTPKDKLVALMDAKIKAEEAKGGLDDEIVELERSWQDYLNDQPESGMGYHVVDVTFDDESVLRSRVVRNGSLLRLPHAFAQKKIVGIEVSSGRLKSERAEIAVSLARGELVAAQEARLAAEREAGTSREALAALIERETQARTDVARLEAALASIQADADQLRVREREAREAQQAAAVDLATASGRAEAAEGAAAEAIAAKDRAIAEAGGLAERLAHAEARATAECERLQLHADDDARQLEAARQALADAEQQVDALMAERTALAAAVEVAGAEVAETKATAERLSAEAEAAETRAREAVTERERLEVDAADVRATATAAAETARLAGAERERLAVELAETTAREQTAGAEAQQARTDAERLQAALDTAMEATGAVEAERDAARAEGESLRTQIAGLRTERETLTGTLTAAQTQAAGAETALAAERDRQTAMIAAHRAVMLEAIGRMVRRECQHARQKRATPAKLRNWLKGFRALHEPVCLDAVTPAIRLHLAWIGSPDDPAAVAGREVARHLDAFEAQIAIALDSDQDDFDTVLERVLTRWESDRPEAFADALMTEEIRHV
jgi:HK97 family phage portal protein